MSVFNYIFINIKENIAKLWRKGAFHIMIGNFATKFVTFFGAIFLSRILSKSDLGILAYIENLCGYAYVFIGFGMSNAVLRYGVLSKSIEDKKAFFKFSCLRGFAFDIVLIAIVLLINMFYPYKQDFYIAKKLIPILILALPFQDIINQFLMNERSMFNNKRFAFFSFLSATMIIISRISGALIDDVEGVVIGILLINIIISLAISISSYNKYFKNILNKSIHKKLKKESTTYAAQYMITNGLWGIFMLIDIFLLGNIIGEPSVVADYKVAYSFPVNMSIFSSAIGIFIAPYFVEKEKDATWIRSNYKKTILITFMIMLVVAFALFIFAKPLIWLFGKQYLNVIPLMRVLIISCFIDTVFRSTTANVLAAIGKVKYNMIISFAGLTCQILINLFMIQKFGAFGVAYTSIIVKSMMALSLFMIFNNIYKIIDFKNFN